MTLVAVKGVNSLIGIFYVLVLHGENAEKPREHAAKMGRQGLDRYCCNYTAMADLQISPFRAGPFCLDAAQASDPSQ